MRPIPEFDIRYGGLRYPVDKKGKGFIKPLEADVLYSSNCLEEITDLCDGLRGLIFEARNIDMDTNPY